MIVYSKRNCEFLDDIDSGEIASIVQESVLQKLGRNVGQAEFNSWSNSLEVMSQVMSRGVPENAGVAIEYNIPQTSNRIDFLITGSDRRGVENVVIVELKQWSSSELTDEDGVVMTYVGGGNRRVAHPSYQSWSYAALLNGFNQAVYEGEIQLNPVAFLHNYRDDGVIRNPFYQEHIDRAPLFLHSDRSLLRNYIGERVERGDDAQILKRLDEGPIRPSKVLADSVSGMLKGNAEFVMIDEQKVVFERARSMARSASQKGAKRNVLIVRGGPGTGKSVVAINLLSRFLKEGLTAHYVTKNSAPRSVYEAKLTGSFKKSEISNLFRGSGGYTTSTPRSVNALIVDEAHRLNEKSGLFNNLGENQIKEIIFSSDFSVFFIDEDQRVHINDIGEVDQIKFWAEKYDAEVEEMELVSQFRCSGSDGYIAWLDEVLDIRETANTNLEDVNYDFQVMDSPTEVFDKIKALNDSGQRSRVVAGYCWDWKSKKDPNASDIQFPEYGFSRQWNLGSDGMLWLLKDSSINEIGCIHTSQGLEMDYVGVIIGKDMTFENGHVVTDVSKRSKNDRSVFGWKKRMKEDPEKTRILTELIIKNTYRTLMTRGMKGCFVWAEDEELNDYLKANR